MTAKDIFALVLVAAAVAGITLAAFGWGTNRPDGSTRFTFRLWAWVSAGVYVWASFGLVDHPRWWHWVAYMGASVYVYSRVQHWWREVEKARRAERSWLTKR